MVFAEGKSCDQLRDTISAHQKANARLLLTRVTEEQFNGLAELPLTVDFVARTATLDATELVEKSPRIAIVTAGTSDIPVAKEALSSARFLGIDAALFVDIGVAGLWRLQEALEDLRTYPLLIAVAGMEGALFSVLAGMVKAPVIAVPTSVGYGVASGGKVALNSALASCAPGLVVVNIDNGFGAAAARKFLMMQTQAST